MLSRSKDLSIGWARHADTLKSYRSLWLPVTHWLHIDSFGMASAFIAVCCMREDYTRLRMFVTMEDNPRSGWYLNNSIGSWRQTTDPHGDMIVRKLFGSDRLYLDIKWSYNGQNPRSHLYVDWESGQWCEVNGRRLLLDIGAEHCLDRSDFVLGKYIYASM